MDELKKMFQTLVNGQSALKQELLQEIKRVDEKFTIRFESLELSMKEGFKKVNKRLDKQGMQLAIVDDDSPNNEEFEDLKRRVETLEQKIAS